MAAGGECVRRDARSTVAAAPRKTVRQRQRPAQAKAARVRERQCRHAISQEKRPDCTRRKSAHQLIAD
eukprot:3456934-Pleurochrysis_carterae.AAC.3